MSAGYASRLKEYPNKGECGLPESRDTVRSLTTKVKTLSNWIITSRRCVVLTGAGISTAAGLPDFRGPKGIWTVEQANNRTAAAIKRRKITPTIIKTKSDPVRLRKLSKVEELSIEVTSSSVSTMATSSVTITPEPELLTTRASPTTSTPSSTTIVPVPPLLSSSITLLKADNAPTDANSIPSKPNRVYQDIEPTKPPLSDVGTVADVPDTTDGNDLVTTADTSLSGSVTNNASNTSAYEMNFLKAQPTFTHRAIQRLVTDNVVQYVVTQNVDGLHRRSGLSRSHHAAMHGCVFTEACHDCLTEHFRDFEVGGMSFQRTGRYCDRCGGDLHDTLLDWEDPLPEDDLERAKQECEKADLVICLGTSLRIEPVGSLPLAAKKFVIVNLQVTPKDDKASLLIRARVDDVMEQVMLQLGYSNWDDETIAPPIEKLWTPPPPKT